MVGRGSLPVCLVVELMAIPFGLSPAAAEKAKNKYCVPVTYLAGLCIVLMFLFSCRHSVILDTLAFGPSESIKCR